MYQDLSMCHDWPVENAMVNLPIEMTGNSKLTFGNTLRTQNINIGAAYLMLILTEVKLHLARYSNGEMTVNQYFHNLQKKNNNKKKNSKAKLSFTHLSRDSDFIKSFVTQWTLFLVRVIKSNSYSCFSYTSLPTLVHKLL